VVVGRVLGGQHRALDAKRGIPVVLELGVPEILREVLLAGCEAGIRRLRVAREGEREADLHRRAVGPCAGPLEGQRLGRRDTGGLEGRSIAPRIVAFQDQHRQAFVAGDEILVEPAELL
jgi:hypothetical protein